MRVSITVPEIESRTFEQILDETLARIPVHNPEYTNFYSESDPGRTILQLFAFMAENIAFVCNQTPERNRLKFLKLLGIPLQPAAAARGVVTITNERGPLETVTLPSGIPMLAGKIGFVTTNGLDVLPVEGRFYVRRSLSAEEQQAATQTYDQLYATYTDASTDLEFYQTVLVSTPAGGASGPAVDLNDGSVVDRTLWLALLVRAGEVASGDAALDQVAGRTLTLGIMPVSDEADRVIRPADPPSAQPNTGLVFEVGTGRLDDGQGPIYSRLDTRADDDPSENLTLVQVTLPTRAGMGTWTLGPLDDGVGEFPPSLDEQEVRDRLLVWLRIRMPDVQAGTSPLPLKGRFSWLGINAARVSQQVPIPAEAVGTGTGEPDQIFTLMATPVILDELLVTVGGVTWQRTDDLLAAPPEVSLRNGTSPSQGALVYAADAESGEIRFGTGLHGARPPAGMPIFASYAYGGGTAGDVGIGAIKSSPQLPAGFKVANPLPTRGGSTGETGADGERRIPLYLQHRDRAVSVDDFREIVKRTPGIDLGRVEVRALLLPGVGVQAPGVVTVLVIPWDPAHPEGPVPDRAFLKAVCDYLEPRRLLTTELHVLGPDYQDVSVSVGIDLLAGRDVAVVREAVKAALRQFLSPLDGGPDGSGWLMEKAVVDRELLARVARVDGIADVRDVWIWDAVGTRRTSIPLKDIQLPRLLRVGVGLGDPEDLAPTPTPPARKRVPVPVLPPGC